LTVPETESQTGKRAAITIPISGMNCAACSARVEKGLHTLPGVLSANVNLVMGKGTINYDPEQIEPRQMIERVKELGYKVLEEQQELLISGMSCAACSARVEKRLNSLPGVQKAAVNLTTNKASISFIPGIITVSEIEKAGYMLYVKDDVGVIVAKTTAPSVIFAINESNLTAAFWDYLRIISGMVIKSEGDRKDTVAKLETIIEKLRD
jgi:copper ion binding protein